MHNLTTKNQTELQRKTNTAQDKFLFTHSRSDYRDENQTTKLRSKSSPPQRESSKRASTYNVGKTEAKGRDGKRERNSLLKNEYKRGSHSSKKTQNSYGNKKEQHEESPQAASSLKVTPKYLNMVYM